MGSKWGYANRDDHPINCIDWHQAKAACEWAGGRLPTEQEWQAEASNQGSRVYPWGDEKPSCDRTVWSQWQAEASNKGNQESSWPGEGLSPDRTIFWEQGGKGCGRDSTWPVCSKQRGNSVSGLCDMAGNVWEWTSSIHFNKNEQVWRVLRGGSWVNTFPQFLQASFRIWYDPALGYDFIGLRCVRSHN